MNVRNVSLGVLAISLIVVASCAPRVAIKGPRYNYSKMNKITKKAHKRVEKFVNIVWETRAPFAISPAVRIDSVVVQKKQKKLTVYFNKPFSYVPFREKNVAQTYKLMKKILGRKFRKYSISIRTLNQPIEQLIPNFFRPDSSRYDFSRLPKISAKRPRPIVENRNQSWRADKGLYDRNIALWPSHGWYYNRKKDRWEWQRPRLFQTVEDLLPFSFTTPYLIPMLEHAGANVFVPRARDIQKKEVVIDNDTSSANRLSGVYREIAADSLHRWHTGDSAGFAYGHPPYPVDFNPFRQGTYRITLSDTSLSARAIWIPDIPETGIYSVSISYHHSGQNVPDARYTVYHAGGKTEFSVNQQMGGETWIYLGRFKFFKGTHPDSGKVVLVNQSGEPGKIITADAVRFGGGMGDILRHGRTSGRARFEEGARYFMQYAGMPDTLVYNFNADTNDYKDDYQGRAEYVNYLVGAPAGPNKDRSVKGLGIPIDLSLAFHTDAGIDRSDTTVGTLSIYSIMDADSQFVFPDSMSRLANRDFADILQTQIVNDIRTKWDPIWSRRSLMDAQYSEAVRPNVPAALLELLSHQNYLDAKFELDPRFRFDVARAIYKGMLKFIATQNRRDYVVEPLPVSHFQAVFSGAREVTLTWQPEQDPLEPTAGANRYVVYTRKDSGGFNNGRVVDQPKAIIKNLKSGVIYSFKVTALNRGGESFPSEILAVCRLDTEKPPVLIINGFDRTSGPASVSAPSFSGFLDNLDRGVPDRYDINFTGAQYNFFPMSKYRTNDAPGFGASHSDFETKIVPGNTFDFPAVHGKSIKACGFPFVSASRLAVTDGQLDISAYKIVDLILGEERETPWPKAVTDSLYSPSFKTFPKKFQEKIRDFCQKGGNLFISGAYVGTDMFANKAPGDSDVQFARNVLKFKWDTDHAARIGKVYSTNPDFLPQIETFDFNTTYNPKIYTVNAPDAIVPANGAKTILRYSENRFSAGIAWQGSHNVVVFGFPFETILGQEAQTRVMKAVLDFLAGEN
ncbi:fibronectin type III domain protein [bacterium BMS3Bbin03]|nr:fibronectin type III domain protein [bacterium BMS3Bbin03]